MTRRAKIGGALTHKAVVQRMAKWLRYSMRCPVVIAELTTANEETPDVLGFHHAGRSILIECKVSRADFLADRQKRFRLFTEAGMGDERYFATPVDLVRPEELPAGWGLFEIEEDGRRLHLRHPAEKQEANKRAEVAMLTSAIRRLELSTAVFVQSAEQIEEPGVD